MVEDPRKTGLKNGLRQLKIDELERVLTYEKDMVLDEFNYQDGKFCPLAVAVGLDSMPNPSHQKVFEELTGLGYTVYNTKGIEGTFYTENRLEDLKQAAQEVLEEKLYQESLIDLIVWYRDEYHRKDFGHNDLIEQVKKNNLEGVERTLDSWLD